MPRIALTQVIYDARRRGFAAEATLKTGALPRHLACFWAGPRDADFARVAQGLSDAALRQAH